MSLIDTGPAMGSTDTPVTDPRTKGPLARIPAWLRFPLYLIGGVLIMSLAREITGARQLTGQGMIESALELSLPIALAGLGGLWSERAGVVNIGLEGMMILGTWFGAYGAVVWGPWQGVLLGIAGGALGGLIHAVATVTFGVDHIISGVAINILALGMTNFLTTITKSWYVDGKPATRQSPSFDDTIMRVDLVPFLNRPMEDLAGQGRFLISDLARLWLALTTNLSLLVVLAVLLFPLTWYVLWRTPVGLRMRSVGEDPEAADSLGVKVYGMKYLGVTVSGAMAGFGGVLLVYLFSNRFATGQTNGRGYIGLAAMIFGNWRPGGLLAGAGLFGLMDSMQSQVSSTAHALLVVAALLFWVMAVIQLVRKRWVPAAALAVLGGLFWFWYQATDELPEQIIPYFPHITTLVVLVFAAQRLRMPAADGKIFRRSGR